MENYSLKLEAPWSEVKEMLQEICPELTEEDLHYEENDEKAMLKKVADRINKDIPATKAWIESVSHNRGLAY